MSIFSLYNYLLVLSVSLTTIELGVTGLLFLSTAVGVVAIRVVTVDDGVGVIVCDTNYKK